MWAYRRTSLYLTLLASPLPPFSIGTRCLNAAGIYHKKADTRNWLTLIKSKTEAVSYGQKNCLRFTEKHLWEQNTGPTYFFLFHIFFLYIIGSVFSNGLSLDLRFEHRKIVLKSIWTCWVNCCVEWKLVQGYVFQQTCLKAFILFSWEHSISMKYHIGIFKSKSPTLTKDISEYGPWCRFKCFNVRKNILINGILFYITISLTILKS